jgi:hypothetical protein
MLIVQHIWTKWTKQSRGANSPVRRPRLAEAYALPAGSRDCAVLLHEVRATEREDFALVQETEPTDRDEFPRRQPHRNNALDWRLWGGKAEILLRKPSEYTQQTKWPAQLPNPLFVLKKGETARIEWNGRFRSSLSGSNLSSYFEQHVYWLALADSPEPRLFLDAEPRKRIDFTSHIY